MKATINCDSRMGSRYRLVVPSQALLALVVLWGVDKASAVPKWPDKLGLPHFLTQS
jgi:hypothetical protein